ncbi:MAG: hypothetical protein WDN72_10310 [Alphaproteobacteria bacterium]
MATTDTNPRYARNDIDGTTTNTTAWGWALAIVAVLLIAGAAYYYFHYTAAGTNPYIGAADTGANGAAMTTTATPGATTDMGTTGAAQTTTPAPATTTPAANQ